MEDEENLVSRKILRKKLNNKEKDCPKKKKKQASELNKSYGLPL